jgi:two-component system, NtrC family, response regulator HydG
MSDPAEPLRVLVIDDEQFHAETVCEVLQRHGYDCVSAHSGKEGTKKLDHQEFDIVLTDLKLGDIDGLAIVKKVKEHHPDTEVMVISGHNDVKSAMNAIKLGAAHYLLKPFDMVELRAVVDQSAQKVQLSRDNRRLRQQLDEKFGFEGVVGNNPKMNEIINRLKALAPTRASVLILGENGTGKELVAKALHTNSPRKNKPFVTMNCAALNENLLDDEMFGHEPGSFTGADKLRKGRFEHAHGGSLFLDEVGDMPLTLQAKLLRVLENGEVSRIGSNEVLKVDVRIITATNKNLEAMIKEGKFRQDLYQRLRVGIIVLPPLRERREDIPLLAKHFVKELSHRHGKKVTGISDEIRRRFATYGWPGNVRELRSQLESMVIYDQDGILDLDDLQEGDSLKQSSGERNTTSGADHLIGRPLAEIERYYAEKTLEMTNNNRLEAAKILGIAERTLYRDIQEWRLQDKIKETLDTTQGDVEAAAKILEMTPAQLERRLKRLRQGETVEE